MVSVDSYGPLLSPFEGVVCNIARVGNNVSWCSCSQGCKRILGNWLSVSPNAVIVFLFFPLLFLMDSSFRSRYLSSVCRVLIIGMGGSGMCGVVHDKLALDLGLTHLTFP
jgi:hypothetical protein